MGSEISPSLVLGMPGIPVTGTPSISLMFGFIHNRHSITSKRDGKLNIKVIDGLPVTGIPGI